MSLPQEYETVPKSLPAADAFVLTAIDRGNKYYQARTDRNIGWITPTEQEMLHTSVVAIAGTGGMGGLVAQAMVRLGVGEIRIADPETFDVSNINRQAAARRETIGHSKALETARLLRGITDDYRLVVYPQGITPETTNPFVRGADAVIDEIEFWNIGSCISLHQAARRHHVPIFNCLTVGFATYLHLFTPDSKPVEDMLGITQKEADALERSVLDGSISGPGREHLMRTVLDCFIPDLPQYFGGSEGAANNARILERLGQEGAASILATNPFVSAGIVANRVLIYLLQAQGSKRKILPLPVSPGYTVFDSAYGITTTILKRASGVAA